MARISLPSPSLVLSCSVPSDLGPSNNEASDLILMHQGVAWAVQHGTPRSTRMDSAIPPLPSPLC